MTVRPEDRGTVGLGDGRLKTEGPKAVRCARTQAQPVKAVRSVRDLEVYALAFEAAMEAFQATKGFPPEERFSLTDQLRRSSRSVPGNIREGFAKRRYANLFARHLTDALGSAEETRTWLDFALRCGYLPPARHQAISDSYDRICAMLFRLLEKWK